MGRFREAMCRAGNQQKGGYHNKTADREDKGISEAPKLIFSLPIHHVGPLRLSRVASRMRLQPKGTGCYP